MSVNGVMEKCTGEERRSVPTDLFVMTENGRGVNPFDLQMTLVGDAASNNQLVLKQYKATPHNASNFPLSASRCVEQLLL
mmetsp:Transcript_45686/g.111311  ORF Transcript_45686/g.111311 Transcript_45686/m.111311 type:complete len:80 (+) Transcript_45686:2753-2992(+)